MKKFTDSVSEQTQKAIAEICNEAPEKAAALIEWGNALDLDGQNVGELYSFILFGGLAVVGSIMILYALCKKKKEES
jgi:hypothetical protein